MATPPRKQASFTFTAQSRRPLTDYDVVMAYDVLLGRHPESSEAIEFHKGTSYPAMISGFLASDEFHDNVYRPLVLGRPVRRGDYRYPPSGDQFGWVFDCLVFSEEQKAALRSSPNWAAFFTQFLTLGGIDLSSEGGANPAASPLAATKTVPPASSPAAEAQPDPAVAILLQLEKVRGLLSDIEASVRALRK